RGVGPNKDHVLLKIDHIGAEAIHEKLPGIHELSLVFAGVDCTKEPIPVMPTAHYQNGGIPTNYLTNVIRGKGANPEETVPGFFAAGEIASASVHGANRLGTNSLLDLVVFGRTAGEQSAKYAKESGFVPLAENAGAEGIALVQKFLNGNGKNTFGPMYKQLTEIMEKYVGVFRTEESMTTARGILVDMSKQLDDYKVNDKSSVYNLELIEALEMNNMVLVARAFTEAALLRKESRGGHAREDYPERDDANFHKHTEVTLDGEGNIQVDYRPVRMKPLTVETFPPKPRVY
ncbi:MAG: FAD-binding protein, partial [Calditerrivibrio sp.]|nr:FAD-binding protein [Calditerrivibrio sp.]